jgi:hypothetical protein
MKNTTYRLLVNISVFFTLFALFAIPAVAGASAVDACDPAKQLCNPTRFSSIQCFLKELLKIAAQIGSVIVVLGIIYSGFLFVVAQGNAEELSKAKRAITYTVIGAALVLGSWAFAVGIANTVNNIINGEPIEINC